MTTAWFSRRSRPERTARERLGPSPAEAALFAILNILFCYMQLLFNSVLWLLIIVIWMIDGRAKSLRCAPMLSHPTIRGRVRAVPHQPGPSRQPLRCDRASYRLAHSCPVQLLPVALYCGEESSMELRGRS